MNREFCPKCDTETVRHKSGSCTCCSYISRYMGQLLSGGMPYAEAREKARKAGLIRDTNAVVPVQKNYTQSEPTNFSKKWECKECGNRRDRWADGSCGPCRRARKKAAYSEKVAAPKSWKCKRCGNKDDRYENGECAPCRRAKGDKKRREKGIKSRKNPPPVLVKNMTPWKCGKCGNTTERRKGGGCAPCLRAYNRTRYAKIKEAEPALLENRRQLNAENRARQLQFEDDPRKHFEGKKDHIKAATPPWLDVFQLSEIQAKYFQARWLSNKSGIKHHVDHIIPLNHPEVCGLHVPWNLQVITWEENQEKGSAKFEDANSF